MSSGRFTNKQFRPRKYGGAIIENGQVIAYRSQTDTSVHTDAPTNSKDENDDRPY